MRLGDHEYRLAKLLAKDAGCTVNETVEMSIRVTFMSFGLRPNGAEQFGALVVQARAFKKELSTPAATPPRRRSSPKKALTHSPFDKLAGLKASK